MPLTRALETARKLRVQFALIVALAMAPGGIVAVYQAAANIEKALQDEETQLRRAARAMTEEERATVIALRERLRYVARMPVIRRMAGEACDAEVTRLGGSNDAFSIAFVADGAGTVMCGARSGLDISKTDVYAAYAQSQGIAVGRVPPGVLTPDPLLLALAPIRDGKRTGILAVGLSTSFFQKIAEGSEALGDARFALVDETGAVFAQSTSGSSDWLPPSLTSLLGGDEVFARLAGRDGEDRLYQTLPLPVDSIWVVAAKPALTWGGLLLGPAGLALVTPLILWAMAVAAGFFVIDRLVSRHIVYLQRVAAAIGRGHLEIGPLRLEGAPYEIRRLGDALERMSHRLAERDSSLRANLAAKRALLLEVHHRVKNNLQMISSLMNMQLRRAGTAEERHSLQIVQDRIHGLALVHQHLYGADRLDRIMLDRLVSDLAAYLRDSLTPEIGDVKLQFDLVPIEASADVATPVALFLTEAVSNAFKHSAVPGQPFILSLSLRRVDGDAFALKIVNDRQAMDRTEHLASGLGKRLMDGFARQIGGTLRYEKSETRFGVCLRAPLAPPTRAFTLRTPKDADPSANGRHRHDAGAA